MLYHRPWSSVATYISFEFTGLIVQEPTALRFVVIRVHADAAIGGEIQTAEPGGRSPFAPHAGVPGVLRRIVRVNRQVLRVVLHPGGAAIQPARAVVRADEHAGAGLEVVRSDARAVGRDESAVVEHDDVVGCPCVRGGVASLVQVADTPALRLIVR